MRPPYGDITSIILDMSSQNLDQKTTSLLPDLAWLDPA